jgi:hypothetical protein
LEWYKKRKETREKKQEKRNKRKDEMRIEKGAIAL